MSDRIRIVNLRRRPFRSKPWVNVTRTELDALLEVVEASEPIGRWFGGRYPASLGPRYLALREALDRFDFGDER